MRWLVEGRRPFALAFLQEAHRSGRARWSNCGDETAGVPGLLADAGNCIERLFSYGFVYWNNLSRPGSTKRPDEYLISLEAHATGDDGYHFPATAAVGRF